MRHYIILYLATLFVMPVPDMLWIGVIARDFYKVRMGDLLEFHLVPAVLFYMMYAVGVVVFANGTASGWQSAILYGALFGFFAYATYDLTNLATLRGWSVSLAVADVAWGTFITGMTSAAAWWIARALER